MSDLLLNTHKFSDWMFLFVFETPQFLNVDTDFHECKVLEKIYNLTYFEKLWIIYTRSDQKVSELIFHKFLETLQLFQHHSLRDPFLSSLILSPLSCRLSLENEKSRQALNQASTGDEKELS